MITVFIRTLHFNILYLREHLRKMLVTFVLFATFHKAVRADVATEEVQFLNELPLDKLLRLKTSLQDLVTDDYENITTTPTYLDTFGAQAMAMKSPIKRGDYEEVNKKDHYSKIGNIFSMSVTTLAFLAFGGYLLCLIVHAVKEKQMYNFTTPTVPQPTTFLVSAGIKKRPQPQFASYGRKRRDDREARSLSEMELPPEHLFSALLQFCEGYAKWSEHRDPSNT